LFLFLFFVFLIVLSCPNSTDPQVLPSQHRSPLCAAVASERAYLLLSCSQVLAQLAAASTKLSPDAWLVTDTVLLRGIVAEIVESPLVMPCASGDSPLAGRPTVSGRTMSLLTFAPFCIPFPARLVLLRKTLGVRRPVNPDGLVWPSRFFVFWFFLNFFFSLIFDF
jgi:hypothetical protein